MVRHISIFRGFGPFQAKSKKTRLLLVKFPFSTALLFVSSLLYKNNLAKKIFTTYVHTREKGQTATPIQTKVVDGWINIFVLDIIRQTAHQNYRKYSEAVM